MIKRVLYTAAGLIFALALVLAVSAQDDELNTTFIFPDGASFIYPAVFRGEMLDGIAAIYDDNYYIAVLNAEALAARGLPANAELLDALALDVDLIYVNTDGLEVNPDAVQTFTLEGRDGVRYRFDDAYGGGLIYAIRFSGGGIGVVYSFGSVDLPPDETLTRRIAQSFNLRGMNQIVAAALETTTLAETATLPGSFSFRYPDTWALAQTPEGAALTSNEHAMQLIPRAGLESIGITPGTLESTLPAVVEYVNRSAETPHTFDAQRTRQLNLRGRQVLRYDFSIDLNTAVTILMIPFANRTFGVLIATTTGALPPQPTILAVADSFDFGSQPRQPAAEVTAEATREATAEATAESTAEATPAVTESAEIPLAAPTLTPTPVIERSPDPLESYID